MTNGQHIKNNHKTGFVAASVLMQNYFHRGKDRCRLLKSAQIKTITRYCKINFTNTWSKIPFYVFFCLLQSTACCIFVPKWHIFNPMCDFEKTPIKKPQLIYKSIEQREPFCGACGQCSSSNSSSFSEAESLHGSSPHEWLCKRSLFIEAAQTHKQYVCLSPHLRFSFTGGYSSKKC